MLKRVVVLVLIVCGALFADENMQKLMYDMENALNKVQKGYLYNNLQMVHEGLDELSALNKQFKDTQMKTFLPENKKHMYNIAVNSSEKIDKAILTMKKNLDKKEYLKAHLACGEIIHGCTSCHGIVRNW